MNHLWARRHAHHKLRIAVCVCVCYLTCCRGSCRMEYILDLLSSMAVTFLLSESAAEREEAFQRSGWSQGGRELWRWRRRDHIPFGYLWELNLSEKGSRMLVSDLLSLGDSLSSSLSVFGENTLNVKQFNVREPAWKYRGSVAWTTEVCLCLLWL